MLQHTASWVSIEANASRLIGSLASHHMATTHTQLIVNFFFFFFNQFSQLQPIGRMGIFIYLGLLRSDFQSYFFNKETKEQLLYFYFVIKWKGGNKFASFPLNFVRSRASASCKIITKVFSLKSPPVLSRLRFIVVT